MECRGAYMQILQYITPAMRPVMKTYCQDEQPAADDRSATHLVVRLLESPSEIQRRLAVNARGPLRERSAEAPSSAQGFAIVALDGEATVGFAVFKAATGAIGVAHELWVDPRVRFGVAPVAHAILAALESAVRAAECSRLFVLMGQSTPLRRILQDVGYVANLTSAEVVWFEKSLVSGPGPFEAA